MMKEKLLRWVRENPHCLVLLYFIPYLIWFFSLEFLVEPKYWIYSPLDDLIPFCEYFIIPYGLWFPYFLGALGFFIRKDKEIFLRLCFIMFTGMTVCLLIYTLMPNGINLRQEITGDNLFCKIALLMRSVDTPTNVCPSIHVSSTLAVDWAVQHYQGFKRPKLVRGLSLLLAVSICLSTVFLKQHSVIDVFYGILLTAGLVAVVRVHDMRGRIVHNTSRGYLNHRASCDKL